MSADLPGLLAQATDGNKSSTERLFAAVALRKQIDLLIGSLDDDPQVGTITAAVVTDVLTKGEGQSGTYHVESGIFEQMTRVARAGIGQSHGVTTARTIAITGVEVQCPICSHPEFERREVLVMWSSAKAPEVVVSPSGDRNWSGRVKDGAKLSAEVCARCRYVLMFMSAD